MALYFASLNSGSNGNCYYVGDRHDAVLVDAGLSCRETERRMQRIGLSLRHVRALFVSHEHTDHIKGVEVISRKFGIPVHISEETLRSSRMKIADHLVRPINDSGETTVAGLAVRAFRKSHDAADPYSFVVSGSGVNVGVFTDIGHGCDALRQHFSTCHAAFLESNYDETMLFEGPYPWYLKRRISGDTGHLSNAQALDIFVNHRAPHLSHLLLAHLSRENNSPQLVKNLFTQHAGNVHVDVASRDYETPVYFVSATGSARLEEQLTLL